MKRLVLLLVLLGLSMAADAFIVNVGFLMQPMSGATEVPPGPTYRITTESGLNITSASVKSNQSPEA